MIALALLPLPGAILGALSGVAMALLALAVERIRPRRPAGTAFAVFAALWGVATLFANLAQLSSNVEEAVLWRHASNALLVLLYLPLVAFLRLSSAKPGVRFAWPTIALLAVPGVLALLAYAAAPTLLLAEAGVNAAGLPSIVPGPLYGPVVITNSVLVFAAALVILARRLARETQPATRSQLALVVAAFALYVSYRAGEGVATIAFFGPGLWEANRLLAVFVALAAVASLAAIVPTLALGARERALPWRSLVLGASLVPLVVAFVDVGAALAGVDFATVGIWRLGMVGLLAYGLARYRVFDLELRLQTVVPPASTLAVAGAILGLVWLAFSDVLLARPVLAAPFALGALLASAPAGRAGAALVARVAPHVQEREYLYKRKLDVYRAALEDAHARGAGEATEQAFLTELRRGLGITEQEHRILLIVLESQARYGPRPRAAGGLAERFEIERELGRGGAGLALLARDKQLGRRVVLKQALPGLALDPQRRDRFLREARVLARLSHPHVVAVYEVLADEDPPVIVMEHMPGGNLEELAARRGPLPLAGAARLLGDVLAGLQAVHDAGLVHRDLKPGNVLLAASGAAKVADFDVARAENDPVLAQTISSEGWQPGSVAYMSPEQARGEPVDARSDLYAAGAILYRLLAGRHYVDFRGHEARARERIQDADPDLRGFSPPVADVLRRALAKRPEDRFPSALAMAEAIARLVPEAPMRTEK